MSHFKGVREVQKERKEQFVRQGDKTPIQRQEEQFIKLSEVVKESQKNV